MAKSSASRPSASKRAAATAAGAKPAAAAKVATKAASAIAGRLTPAKLPRAVTVVVRAALDKKAEDVVVLDLRKAGGFTDYFVICTGGNPRQITAIAEAVDETLKKELRERPSLAECLDKSEWILLDYFNFVVHIFSRECRTFYGLERLWGNAVRHQFSDPHEERGL
jgi:ribosome-associated protein